jgi:hypothetical protein
MTTKPKPRKAPAEYEESHKLIDAMDMLSSARAYIECVHMAAASLSPHQIGPISAVADMASDKIHDAISLLEEFNREAPTCVECPN